MPMLPLNRSCDAFCYFLHIYTVPVKSLETLSHFKSKGKCVKMFDWYCTSCYNLYNFIMLDDDAHGHIS